MITRLVQLNWNLKNVVPQIDIENNDFLAILLWCLPRHSISILIFSFKPKIDFFSNHSLFLNKCVVYD